MIITRYLTREVVRITLGVTLLLVIGFLCQQGIRYLNYVAIGKVPFNVLLRLLIFEAPFLIALLLPFAFYLGVILTLGRWQADHELAILKLCGYGHFKMMRTILGLAVMVALLVFFFMSYINPWVANKREQVLAAEQAVLHLMQTVMPGRFQASPDGRYVVYVEKLSRDRERAKNVFLAQESKLAANETRSLWMLVSAEEGYRKQNLDVNSTYFVMQNGYRYEGVPGKKDFKVIKFEKYAIRIPQPEVQVIHQKDESDTTLFLLENYSNPAKAAELQWRISIALSAFFLAFLAVPLGLLTFKKNRFIVLLPAMLIYIVYINLLFVARRFVEQGQIPIAWGMWWVHGIVVLFLIGQVLFRHKKWDMKC